MHKRQYMLSLPERQGGLSLIELMVATAIGLILIGAVLQAFLSSNQTHRVNDALARIQEDGRAAIFFLTRDIRKADYWGCIPQNSMITSQLDTGSANYNAALHDFSNTGAIAGTNDNGLNGSDTLTLKGASDNGLQVMPPVMPNTAAALHIKNNSGLVENQIVLLSDCVTGDIFQITNDPSTGGGIDDTAVHNGGNVSAGPGNGSSNLSKSYGLDAQIFGLQSLVYSLGTDALNEPVLMRNGLELVQNVQNMQFLYGEDTDGDFSANYYVPSTQVVNMDNVVSIRVSLLIRSTDTDLAEAAQTYNFNGQAVVAPANDTRMRRVFTSTVSIRNRLN